MIVLISASRILDIESTYQCLKVGGFELNPFTRFFIDRFGINNIWGLIPIQITISVIEIILIYALINITINSRKVNIGKYITFYNVFLILFILLNFSTFVNNYMVMMMYL